MEVKICNGKEHVMSVEEAARRISGLGLRVGEFPEALSMPYNINFPWVVSVGEDGIEAHGSHKAIRALQLAVNHD